MSLHLKDERTEEIKASFAETQLLDKHKSHTINSDISLDDKIQFSTIASPFDGKSNLIYGSQSPTKENIGVFWNMILATQVSLVVMLCDHIESKNCFFDYTQPLGLEFDDQKTGDSQYSVKFSEPI